MNKPDDLADRVPQKWQPAIITLKSLLVKTLYPDVPVTCRIYGDLIAGHDLFRLCEIDFASPDTGAGCSLMSCEPLCLGILRACEEWLETFFTQPYRPDGWDSDVDEHADAEWRLIELLKEPSSKDPGEHATLPPGELPRPETQVVELGVNQSIIIQVDGQGNGSITNKGIKEVYFSSSQAECGRSGDSGSGEEAWLVYNAAVDGMESLLLALACAGINVTEDRYQQAVQTALDAIGNHDA
jgi:hypothetical protein